MVSLPTLKLVELLLLEYARMSEVLHLPPGNS